MIEVRILGFAQDKQEGTPILLLEEVGGERRVLPIWIGQYEADALIRALNNYRYRRPLTHELLVSIIKGLGYSVTKVEVTEVKNNTFYALICLRKDKDIYEVDARPSDAITIATMTHAPIYVAESVMDSSGIKLDIGSGEKTDVREYLKKVNPEEFGEIEL